MPWKKSAASTVFRPLSVATFRLIAEGGIKVVEGQGEPTGWHPPWQLAAFEPYQPAPPAIAAPQSGSYWIAYGTASSAAMPAA